MSLEADGFVVLRGWITSTWAVRAAATVRRNAELTSQFYGHGQVAADPELMSVLWEQDVVSAARSVLGSTVTCLAGLDTVGVDVSESVPHRDVSVGRLPARGRDPWRPRLGVVRVALYPEPRAATFGLVRGSHRVAGSPSELFNHENVEWWQIGGGDVLVFDPRLVHAGSPGEGPRTMIVLTYGNDGDAARDIYFDAMLNMPELPLGRSLSLVIPELMGRGLLLEGAADPRRLADYRRIVGTPDG